MEKIKRTEFIEQKNRDTLTLLLENSMCPSYFRGR